MGIRILIGDDHGLIRAGLSALLRSEPNFEVVGEACDGESALELAYSLRPDILLLDVSMPGPSGIEITRKLSQTLPDTRVLILTIHEDMGLMREAIRAGAAGYIIKRAVDAELMSAIDAVSRGDLYVHPAMTRALVEELMPDRAADKNNGLTPREIEILRLIARGNSNRQIAEILSLSVRTVDTHRSNLMAKLGLHDRADLVRYASERRLI
jgi:two-component system response regulator NreC